MLEANVTYIPSPVEKDTMDVSLYLSECLTFVGAIIFRILSQISDKAITLMNCNNKFLPISGFTLSQRSSKKR